MRSIPRDAWSRDHNLEGGLYYKSIAYSSLIARDWFEDFEQALASSSGCRISCGQGGLAYAEPEVRSESF